MYSIRDLVPEDAEDLRSLYVLSLSLNKAGFIQDPEHHGDIFADRAQKYQQERGCMVGLFDVSQKLYGFGSLENISATHVHLCNLHLHPDLQNKGLGAKIARHLLDRARTLGYSMVELHVTATQSAAINLYKHLGFIETDRRIYDVKGQIFDTIFMELELELDTYFLSKASS